jgi:hypothetical protein
VSEQTSEPADADGPLFRAAQRRAAEVDDGVPGRRRKAWARFLVTAGLALAEGFLRNTFVWGAVLFSLVAIGSGVTAGDMAWAVPLVVSGVVGIALVFWSIARRWSFGRQWAVLLGVIIVQIVLIIVQWRSQ